MDLYRNLLNGICCGGLFGGRGDPGSKTGPGSERCRNDGVGLVHCADVRAVDCSVGLSEDLAVDLCPNEWLLASSPMSLILVVTGAGLSWTLDDAVIWMIEIQLAAGTLLIALAVVRFRPACRAAEDLRPATFRNRWPVLYREKRPLDRFPCDDNPVLWKELFTSRRRGLVRAAELIVIVGLAGLISYGTYLFARPAFIEWYASGFGRGTSQVHRIEFNEFLRAITAFLEFLILLVVASAAAEGVSQERARETWDGLIATPLSGSAILRAKQIAAVWQVRWGAMFLGLLWSVGLVTGSLHPMGFALALVVLGTSMMFMSALGTYQSLVSRDTAQATTRTLLVALLLMGSFAICYLPPRLTSVLCGCVSPPFVAFLCLGSYADIDELTAAAETAPGLSGCTLVPTRVRYIFPPRFCWESPAWLRLLTGSIAPQ